MRYAFILGVLFAATAANAQWEIQTAPTTADLRGIHAIGSGVAWASGTDGTVLRTTDDGAHWQRCSIPPGAEKLDFRGIQGFDEMTAIVMSTGKGPLSRLYKTTDACQTWKLVFTNPDKDGSYDALKMIDRNFGIVLGDPSHSDPQRSPFQSGIFRLRVTENGGLTWGPITDPRSDAAPGTGLIPLTNEVFFAASNSSILVTDGQLRVITSRGRILQTRITIPGSFHPSGCAGMVDTLSGMCPIPWSDWINTSTPLSQHSSSSGAFAFFYGSARSLIAVGGDYEQPDRSDHTSAYLSDSGDHWTLAQTPPHGFRSAVAYDTVSNSWLTVGPNGTDISTDDGRNWRALHPNPALHEPTDADRNWNALSLPFVVGPHGRIGRLRTGALSAPLR